MKMKTHQKKWAILISIAILGLTAITTQILLIRELMVIFYGNELSLGIIFGLWLLWTAMGSLLLPRLFPAKNQPEKHLGLIHLLIALLLPLVLFVVRTSKQILGITLGEMIGFQPMFLISFMTLAPFCLLSGYYFSIACRTVFTITENPSAIGKVYVWEAVGSGAGGVIVSFFFIRLLSPIQIIILLFILNCISSLLQIYKNRFHKNHWWIGWSSLLVLFGVCGLLFSTKLQNIYDRILWRGFNLVKTVNSNYGNIAVTQMGELVSFFQNGLHIFSMPDPQSAEESVHYALLEHPEPRSLLCIGGALTETIKQALKHPSIQTVDYIELDPLLAELILLKIPHKESNIINDPRVSLLHLDGRLYVKRTNKKYDVVLLNLPNPYTAQLNRFYTREFFHEVNRLLTDGGIFSFQVTSSENAIGPELSEFLSVLWTSLTTVFPDPIVLPGEINRFMASNKPDLVTTDSNILITRLKNRNLNTLYVREYFLPFQLSEERVNYLKSRIHYLDTKKVNQDFKPIGFYYDTILWATTYSKGFKAVFLAFKKIKPHTIIGFLGILSIIMILLTGKRKKDYHNRIGISASLFVVGFSEISLEVILILSFQVLYGYVYQQMAIIIAGYMIGLTLGSRKSTIHQVSSIEEFRLFRKFQLYMALLPFGLVGMLYGLHHFMPSGPGAYWLGWIFPVIAALSGFIGGFQFPLANRLYLRTEQNVEKTAGFLYGLDLLGSASGAFMTSAFFLPVFGVFTTLMLIGCLNICCVLLLFATRKIQRSI
jgi:spermidine synthase